MKSRFRMATAAVSSAALLTAAAAVSTAPTAAASDVFQCNGTAENITIKKDLVVPEGGSCKLSNVVVKGDVTLQRGSTLIVRKGQYQGDVTIGTYAYLDMIDARVDQSVNNDGSASISSSDLRGDYITTGSRTEPGLVSDAFSEVSFGRDIAMSSSASADIDSSIVAGSITAKGTSGLFVDNSVVRGSLTTDGDQAKHSSVLCASEIYGDARISDQNGFLIGFGSSCGSSYFGRNLTVEKVRDYAEVSNSIVAGDLSGEGNELVAGENNRVRGEVSGQFVDLESPREPWLTESAASQKQSSDATKKANAERREEASAKAKAAGKVN